MIERDIISSNGSKSGFVHILQNKIIVNTFNKPVVEITDINEINKILNKTDDMIVKLYDDYTLTISEIAALYDMKYHQVRQKILSLNTKTSKKSGRRNSSYSLQFSDERLKHLSESHKGKPCKTIYERTPEIKEKISNTLKNGYKSGRIVVNRKAISRAWERGCYKESKMGTSKQGYMYSVKNKKDVYFRSMLELYYYIILESDSTVTSYAVEPFLISLSDSSVYIPDLIINNHTVVEIKTEYRANADKRFKMEVAALSDYCKINSLDYKIVYDKDLSYDTKKFVKYLNENSNIVEQFNIRYV